MPPHPAMFEKPPVSGKADGSTSPGEAQLFAGPHAQRGDAFSAPDSASFPKLGVLSFGVAWGLYGGPHISGKCNIKRPSS